MRRYSAFFLLLLLLSCLDPYDPDLPPSANDLIVIDGFVDAGRATAVVKIQRSLSLEKDGPFPMIRHANVTIIASDGSQNTLHENSPGLYEAKNIHTGRDYQYTLHVLTTDGGEYFSDPQRVYDTPPIDSITTAIAITGDDLSFRVNTHNPQSESFFYAWDYVETFEYTAPMYSGWIKTPSGPRTRLPDENIYTCWKTTQSTKVLIGSTRGLSANVVRNFELLTIPRRSLKLSTRYSLLVKQRVIDEDEYNYLSLIRKTTESIGGLFDPLPAPVHGNMHSSDDVSQPVLGYFRAGKVEEKRFFIRFEELPQYFQILPYDECETFPACSRPAVIPANGPSPTCVPFEDVPDFWPLIEVVQSGPASYSGTYTSERCGDCRARGGVTRRPDFW